MKWLIENNYFDKEEEDEIISIIDSLGDEYYNGDRPQNVDFIDFAIGSINFVSLYGREYHFTDFTMSNFRCSKYYPSWGDYILNREYYFYPASFLKTDIPFITINSSCCCGECDSDYISDGIFVRPDGGHKPFSGMVLDRLNRPYVQILELDNISPDELVVVSPVKLIEKEYRFFVTDKILSCCQYFKDGTSSSGVPKNAVNFVNKILEDESLFIPSPVGFVIDIAKTDYGYKVIELNSIECSGFYGCSIYEIIKGVKESYDKLTKWW